MHVSRTYMLLTSKSTQISMYIRTVCMVQTDIQYHIKHARKVCVMKYSMCICTYVCEYLVIVETDPKKQLHIEKCEAQDNMYLSNSSGKCLGSKYVHTPFSA